MDRVRPYDEKDFAALVRMHERQGFSYPFPYLGPKDAFANKMVVEDDDGNVVMAILARLTAEAFLLMDNEGRPRQRWDRFRRLHQAMEVALWLQGLDDVHCWVPPSIARSFGRRLESLGWARDMDWPCYSLLLKGVSLNGTRQQGTTEVSRIAAGHPE